MGPIIYSKPVNNKHIVKQSQKKLFCKRRYKLLYCNFPIVWLAKQDIDLGIKSGCSAW